METAIELLEQGRGILWNQLLERRTDLDDVARSHPDLAADLSRQLRLLEGQPTATAPVPGKRNDAVAEASQRVDRIIAQIRTQEGFGNFLKSPTLGDLSPAAAGGPVIVLNESPARCDALVLTVDGVRSVALPKLEHRAIVQMAPKYLIALDAYFSNDRSAYERAEAADTITRVLDWLWVAAVEPVLSELQFVRAADSTVLPRIWWCPTGLMGMFPLHAAGTSDQRCNALDYVISSYTPTLRALAEARRTRAQPASGTRFLSVAMPHTPAEGDSANHWPDLPGVLDELDRLKSLFADDHHTILTGETATCAAVINGLKTHRGAHLACHGGVNYRSPSHGGLVLHDGVLPIAAIADQHLLSEFVYLSACDTHVATVENIDEAITLASAMSYVGCRHVVATLSEIADDDAVDVVEAVYRELTGQGRFTPENSARAVHAAVQILRSRYPHNPVRWAPFIHLGP